MNTELRKAAIVLASLDVDTAISVCRHLPDVEAEEVIAEMARLGRVDSDEQRRALEDFSGHLERPGAIRPSEHAERLMAAVLGRHAPGGDGRREAALQRLRALTNAEPSSIRRLLAAETPQMVAVVLSQLSPQKAAQVLAQWPPELRSDLALRVAKLGHLAPGALESIGEVLGRQAYRVDDEGSVEQGLEFVVRLLEGMDRGASKRALAELRERDAELAEQVEDRLFTFENVLQLTDAYLQILLRSLDNAVIARALKGADETVRERIFANLSERGREMLEQEIELLGPVLVRDVEAAQREFVSLALELEQAGEITLSSNDAEYIE